MTQSSAALEISDDESKAEVVTKSGLKEDRGKENVDPDGSPTAEQESSTSIDLAATTEDSDSMNTEEPRTPLGDLNAANFYGEGLDATSVVVILDEHDADDDLHEQHDVHSPAGHTEYEAQDLTPVTSCVDTEFTFEVNGQCLSAPTSEDVSAEIVPEWAQRTTSSLGESDESVSLESSGSDLTIDIWESESAKGDDEQEDNETHSNCIVVGEGERISLSSVFLGEL